MDIEASIWIFQLVSAAGLAAWMVVAVVNNLQGFHASTGAVGMTMGMSLLREPPFGDLPFLKRAVTSPALHRVALSGVIAVQILSAVPLCWGTALLVSRPFTIAPAPTAAVLNLGLGAFMLCWSTMFVAGLWFAFWIRQEGLLLTQLLLALWGMLGFAIFNLPLALAAAP